MPSIVPGYEYDIFISYRHNDNLDGWVTDFVLNLEKELKATVKDRLTIYFDKNPHDGLLETHEVHDSLREKLKCTILIPIISQTYCDPKSFAWRNEFLEFKQLASDDQLGLRIKLQNGNVASRILLVRIHQLDDHDEALLENELGSIRAIDFIFTSAGVNRPLRAHEEHRLDNQNKTFYRDQINKVANSIKDVISSVKHDKPDSVSKVKIKSHGVAPKVKMAISVVGSILLTFSLVAYIIYQKLPARANSKTIDKSVAVLAFQDMSPTKDQEWFSDGLSDEILNSLANLPQLKVTARASSFYFKGKDVKLSEVARQLGVAHIVEGSVKKIDKQLRISVQLIRAADGIDIWSKVYNRSTDDLFKVQTDIAESIARELLTELSPESQDRLSNNRPANFDPYEKYLKDLKQHFGYYFASGKESDFKKAEAYFLKSIALDSTYADSYGALADLYDSHAGASRSANDTSAASKFRKLRDSLTLIGYQLDPNSLETLAVLSYMAPSFDSTFSILKTMNKLDPENRATMIAVQSFYNQINLNDLAIPIQAKINEEDPLNPIFLEQHARLSYELGNYEEAKKNCEKILEKASDSRYAHHVLGMIAVDQRNRDEANRQLEILVRLNGFNTTLKSRILALEGKKTEALKINPKGLSLLSMLGSKKEFLDTLDSLLASKDLKTSFFALENFKVYDFVRGEPRFQAVLQKVKTDHDLMMALYGNLN